jgi:rRNA maturation endonuclease Nob1
MERYCTKCGKILEENAVYCPSCGVKIDGNNQAINNLPIQKIHKKGILVFISLFLVLAIIAISIIFLTRSTPEKTINNFVKCYNNKDINGMMDCIEPNAQSVYKGFATLFSGLAGYSVDDVFNVILGSIEYTDEVSRPQIDFKIINVDYKSKEYAVVEAIFFYIKEDDTNTTKIIELVKIDGNWYIYLDGLSPNGLTDIKNNEVMLRDSKDNENSGEIITYTIEIMADSPSKQEIADITKIIKKRIGKFSENASVKPQDNNRIILKVPKEDNIDEEIMAGVLREGRFEIQDEQGNMLIHNSEIQRVEAVEDTILGYAVCIKLTEEGTEIFAQATEDNIGKVINFYTDDVMIQASTVTSPIRSGECYILGFDNKEEAESLAFLINSGYLKYELKIVED